MYVRGVPEEGFGRQDSEQMSQLHSQWIKVKSIIDENGRLIGETCPVCEQRQKNGRYFKYFTGVDCPLCKQTEGLIESLKDKGFTVEKYSNDNPDGLAELSYHSILSVPTLMLFEGEDKKTAEWIGEIRKADVMAELKNVIVDIKVLEKGDL